ncbi:hypothetical protein MTO96_046024 [Rhipicephalus appendiculatus]
MKRVLAPTTFKDIDPEWRNATVRIMAAKRAGPLAESEKQFSYVRDGNVGGWQPYFSLDQLRRLEERIKELERHSSVMDLWKDIREAAQGLIGVDENK